MKRTKPREFTLHLSNLPCPCGGTLKHQRIKAGDEGCDVSDILGVPALVHGEFAGLICDRCGKSAFAGRMLEIISKEAVFVVLGQGRRLTGREAEFLRKEALGISRVELGQRLGIAKEEVADFERAEGLTPHQDYVVRSLVIGRILRECRTGVPRWKRDQRRLLELSDFVLSGARDVAAPRAPAPLRLAA